MSSHAQAPYPLTALPAVVKSGLIRRNRTGLGDFDGGVGGAPPTSLDTQREFAPKRDTATVSGAPTRATRGTSSTPSTTANTTATTSGRRTRQVKRWAKRHRLGRGSKVGHRQWIGATAKVLARDGHLDLAHNLASCGRMARVAECGSCGDQHAAVEVRASCGLRICPWCARLQTAERVRLVSGACERVEGYQRAQKAAVLSELAADAAAASSAVDHWTGYAAAAEARAGRSTGAAVAKALAVAGRHRERALRAAERLALARRETKAAGELHRWSWKLVTVSGPWAPLDPREYTPERLRQRAEDVIARFMRAWNAGARAGGLAAATVRVELSEHGHVHVHVLYRGPWVDQKWWQKVCGSIVDIRRVYDKETGNDPSAFAGVPEAVKYAIKVPSVLHADWISGAAFQAAHPELAAAWLVATRHFQITRHLGVMRDAIAAESAAQEVEETPSAEERCRCASCGASLVAAELWRLVPTHVVAGVLGPKWRAAGGKTVWGEQLPKRVRLCYAPI